MNPKGGHRALPKTNINFLVCGCVSLARVWVQQPKTVSHFPAAVSIHWRLCGHHGCLSRYGCCIMFKSVFGSGISVNISGISFHRSTIITFTLISNLATDYMQKRRGEPGLFSFEYNLLPNLISNFNHYMDRALSNFFLHVDIKVIFQTILV